MEVMQLMRRRTSTCESRFNLQKNLFYLFKFRVKRTRVKTIPLHQDVSRVSTNRLSALCFVELVRNPTPSTCCVPIMCSKTHGTSSHKKSNAIVATTNYAYATSIHQHEVHHPQTCCLCHVGNYFGRLRQRRKLWTTRRRTVLFY